jgi:alkylated DNA repair dioxygenase AlkB
MDMIPQPIIDDLVSYYPNFFSKKESQVFFDELSAQLNWQHDTLKIFGKEITTGRQYAWHGDAPYDYAYSGKSRIAEPWSEIILEIKAQIEKQLGEQFNCCLLNFYNDGSQGMSWHSDDEKVMEKHGTIASLSLGAPRNFDFKHKHTGMKQRILLENGSLLEMKGGTQQQYFHQLPKSVKLKEARINLTFRRFSLTNDTKS